MHRYIDPPWGQAEFDGNSLHDETPYLDALRWSFAYLPDPRMKAVAAGWMVRVLLGGDPAEMSDEELETLAMGALLAANRKDAGRVGLGCDA